MLFITTATQVQALHNTKTINVIPESCNIKGTIGLLEKRECNHQIVKKDNYFTEQVGEPKPLSQDKAQAMHNTKNYCYDAAEFQSGGERCAARKRESNL